MKKTIIASALTLPLLSFNALADFDKEKNTYFSFGYSSLKYKESTIETSGLGTLNVGIGKMYSKYFGLEGRLGLGLNETSQNISIAGYPANYQMKVENSLSILGVLNFPVSKNFNLFLKGGFSKINLSRSADVYKNGNTIHVAADDSGSSAVVTVGTNFNIGHDYALDFEAGSYYNREGITLTGLTLGMQKYF